MNRFHCDRCGTEADFTADECTFCHAALGFVPESMRVMAMVPDPGGFTLFSDGPAGQTSGVQWRCLNFAWGCNWVLPAGAGGVWCDSCRLTRNRPATSSVDGVLTWGLAEQVKRRLVYQLRTLGLPTTGLSFDLVHVPGGAGVTGHGGGRITLDLREVDDRYRDDVRRGFDEPARTVVGHLRHEVGHHFWHLLVPAGDVLDECRSLFGDERADYEAALRTHYAGSRAQLDTSTWISGYATAHPSEDWAETFAHYLHLRDGLETAAAYGLAAPVAPDDDFAAIVARWRATFTATNEIAASVGQPAVYPFDLADRVVDKLEFVHRRLLIATGVPPIESEAP